MPKLISLVQPYEIKNIKNIQQFLIFAKNIIRIICTKGCQEKIDGILVPVRWSKEKKKWVVDRGTNLNRDKLGIDLDNIEMFYDKNNIMYNAVNFVLNTVNSLDNINIIGQDYGLLKNSSKFIAFEYVNNKTNVIDYKKQCIYTLGLYQRHNKNRDIIYNKKNTQSTLLSCDDSFKKRLNHERINKPKFFKINENYKQVYSEFTSELAEKDFKKEEMSFLIKTNHDLKSVSSLKKIKTIYNSKEDVLYDKEFKSQMLNVYLSAFLGEFLKRKLDISGYEGVVVYDRVLAKSIKITGNSIFQDKKQFKNNLLDDKCDYNPLHMIPKAF